MHDLSIIVYIDINSFLIKFSYLIIWSVRYHCLCQRQIMIHAYRYTATRVLCYYYYPPCQVKNSTHFIPPPSVCTDTCNYSVDIVCFIQYQQLLAYAITIKDYLDEYNLHYPNCSDISFPIRPLGQSCCSNAGAQGGKVSFIMMHKKKCEAKYICITVMLAMILSKVW